MGAELGEFSPLREEKLPEELSKFSEEERRLLESAPKYEVRFFLLELAEKIGIWFRSR